MKREIFHIITCIILIPLLSALSIPAHALAPAYNVIDLGTLGGNYSRAYAVNSSGWVVGESKNASGVYRAFLWRPGVGMQDLGTFGGPQATAHGINDSGQVVGYAENTSGFSRAFLWQAGSGMTDLGTLGGNESTAYAINNNAQVVGDAFVTTSWYAFRWQAGAGMSSLSGDPQMGPSTAYAISGNGAVVGSSLSYGEWDHGFYWTAGSGMIDVGTFGGIGSNARGVNNSGQVVGSAERPGPYPYVRGAWRAYLWQAGTGMIDLGDFGGTQSGAYGINNLGQVVGWATDANNVGHPFLWESGTGLTDLNTLIDPASGWNPSSLFPYALNDNGWIVGWGTAPNGQTHPFLLQPVPEPAGTLVLGASAVALGLARRRYRGKRR